MNPLRLAFLLVTLLLANPLHGATTIELVPPLDLRWGIIVTDESGKPIRTLRPFGGNETPVWRLGQWWCKQLIGDATPSTLGDGSVLYANREASLRVFPDGGGVALKLDSNVTYNNTFRDGKTKDWPHVLFNASISAPGGWRADVAPYVNDMTRLDFEAKVRLTQSEHNHDPAQGYNPRIHAAQFLVFFTVQKFKKGDPDHHNFIWFGVKFFDDRHEQIFTGNQHDKQSAKLIYRLGINDLDPDANLRDGQWHNLQGDLLPHVKAGIAKAHELGYFETDSSAYFKIGGMNFGWETPGLSNATVHVEKLQLTATVNDPSCR